MKIPFKDISRNRKLENIIFISCLIVLLKLFFYSDTGITIYLISECLIFALFYFISLYFDDFFQRKNFVPIPVILNVGVLIVIIFFVLSVSGSAIKGKLVNTVSEAQMFFYILASFLLIGAISYIFVAFKHLFFLKQKKNPAKYFNVMVLFFVISYFLSALKHFSTGYDYLYHAFTIVSLLLISLNSLRVAWIAFLPKREKIYLIIISIVIAVLFLFSIVFSNPENYFVIALKGFSEGTWTFMDLVMIYGVIYGFVIFFTALFHLPTAEAFDRKAEEVSSLMDLSKIITQVFDLKKLSETIVTLTSKICNSDCAWLITFKGDEFEIQYVTDIGIHEADKVTRKILLEIPERVDEILTLSKSSVRITLENDVKIFNFNSIAIAPLKTHESIRGYLFAAKRTDSVFDEEDKKAISAYADYASVAFENAVLFAESIEKERMEKELEVAREIQSKILPASLPNTKNLKIASRFKPAYEVGGDYYDFFELGNDQLGFVVADVSGKGISAAFIMAEVKGVFESLAAIYYSPKELLIKANEILFQSLARKNFVTAVYGVINLKSGKVNLARAGHTPILVIKEGICEELTPNGIGIGLDNGTNFNQNISELEIKLNNTDILVLYSDGITESKNIKLEDFGLDRFEKLIQQNYLLNVENISDIVISELESFSKEYIQHDDITLVLFKWGN